MGPASPSNMNGNVTRAEVTKKHHSAHLQFTLNMYVLFLHKTQRFYHTTLKEWALAQQCLSRPHSLAIKGDDAFVIQEKR